MNKYNDKNLQLLLDTYLLALEFRRNPLKRKIRKQLWKLNDKLESSGIYYSLSKQFGSFTFGYSPTGWTAQLYTIENKPYKPYKLNRSDVPYRRHKRITVERKDKLFYYMTRNLRIMVRDYLISEYNFIPYSWKME